MRNPTLRRDIFQSGGLGRFSGAGDDQKDSADQCKSTEDGREGDVFLPFRSGVNRAKINDFFPTGVVEALVSQRQSAKNDQKDANHHCRFHSLRFPIKWRLFGP